jgi:chemotaxis protein methyltransferase CheR
MGELESDISQPVLEVILKLVYKHTGISMTEKKKSLIQRRLGPRLKELSLDTYNDYVAYFTSHPEETEEFINRVTTNETFFFRTQRVWDYFEKEFLPEWLIQSPGRTLRVWSAASSSGEEPYSIAMICREFQKKNSGFLFQISATDISTDVLKLAEKGTYSGRSIEDLKTRFPLLMEEYFSSVAPNSYQLCPELRASVKFSTHNLFHTPKVREAFDIVFLRNVMIYFGFEDQERVLKNVAESLVPKGILILGESESLARFQTSFQFVAPLVYKKSGES